MAISNITSTDRVSFGGTSFGSASYDPEFKNYDRVRSSDAHILLDINGEIVPIGHFDKFGCKQKSEIIYRQPIGSKVPIGEHKPGGWDLSLSAGLIDDRMSLHHDTMTKTKFDGLPTQRLTILQRIRYTGTAHLAQATGVSTGRVVSYYLYEVVLAGYEINDPGEGNPFEENSTGYARFREKSLA
jgi:hypothetical protein